VGAVISLELEDDEDSSFAELPWLVTFEPDDDEGSQQWDAFSCGPYLRSHALAIAEAVAFEQDGVIAVVSPVLPALTPDDVTAMIDQRRAEAEAEATDDDDELDDEEESEDVDEFEDAEDADEFEDAEDEEDGDELDDELDDEDGDELDDEDEDVAEADVDEDVDELDDEEEDDEDDADDLDVVEIDVEEIEVPLPEEIRAGIETVMLRLLAHTAPVAESA
jgi:hypothetical protein